MDKQFAIQFAGSFAAVALLVALAAWAKIAKPMSPLSDARARALFADEFPGKVLDGLWVANDGRGRSPALAPRPWCCARWATAMPPATSPGPRPWPPASATGC
uniref:Uncharacterized protein n=1 Tax=Phenylobacterium glaciei TaxID=2803784 RepID=A0A974P1E8_9CAUL|nr:hypothetical protein JKL49_13905 [Phenylobacterium glaciei]